MKPLHKETEVKEQINPSYFIEFGESKIKLVQTGCLECDPPIILLDKSNDDTILFPYDFTPGEDCNFTTEIILKCMII